MRSEKKFNRGAITGQCGVNYYAKSGLSLLFFLGILAVSLSWPKNRFILDFLLGSNLQTKVNIGWILHTQTRTCLIKSCHVIFSCNLCIYLGGEMLALHQQFGHLITMLWCSIWICVKKILGNTNTSIYRSCTSTSLLHVKMITRVAICLSAMMDCWVLTFLLDEESINYLVLYNEERWSEGRWP